jgi:hypothetical protein
MKMEIATRQNVQRKGKFSHKFYQTKWHDMTNMRGEEFEMARFHVYKIINNAITLTQIQRRYMLGGGLKIRAPWDGAPTTLVQPRRRADTSA